MSRAAVARFFVRILPPALLGSITVFAFAPFSVWPLAPISLAFIFGMIEVAPSAKRAALVGWAYGLGFFLANVHWLYIALHTFGDMPAPLAAFCILLLAMLLGLFPSLAAWLARRAAGDSRTALLLGALPACWLLTEWLRSWIFTGFPWASIGYSQIPNGPLAGYASVLGVFGIGCLLALFGGLLAWLMGRKLDRHAIVAVSLIILIAGGGIGLHHIQWTHASGQPLKVSLLQGNIPQNRKWNDEDLIYNLRTYLDQVHDAQGDLLVTPETAFPIFLHDVPKDYLDEMLGDARRKHAALIVGVPRLDKSTNQYYNGAVLLTDPKYPSNYKSHLVPFGEYVPLHPVFGWVYDNLLHIPYNDFTPGAHEQTPLNVRDQRIAANICYEDIFGSELIANARKATILLNMSNLAWFDGSVALAQHGQIAQTRAIESGRPVLLATNSGTTAVVDPDGHYQSSLPEGVQGILSATVQGRDGTTPYMIWGDWLSVSLAAAGLLYALWEKRRDRLKAHA